MEKQLARQALKQIGKRIPFIGQGISATTSFVVTFSTSRSYCNKCAQIAGAILKERLSSYSN